MEKVIMAGLYVALANQIIKNECIVYRLWAKYTFCIHHHVSAYIL